MKKDIIPPNLEPVRFDLEGTQKERPIRISGIVYNPFSGAGTWLRANLHCHLTRVKQDPQWPSTALKQYRSRGYDVVGGMCHDQVVTPEPVEGITVLPGAEISCGGHLLGLGISAIPESGAQGERVDTISAMIRRVKEAGGLTFLAHPFKSAYTWKELNAFCDAGLDGLEIVNSNVRGKGADTGRADQIWHNLLREGRRLTAVGGDDAHGPHEDIRESGWGGIPHTAFTGIWAKGRTPEAVLEALRHGCTYASEGPEFHSISVTENGKMEVRCSPCVACHFRSVGSEWGGDSAYSPDGRSDSDTFVFDFTRQGYRIRDSLVIILQDIHGRRAWTSPIRTDIAITEENA